MTDITFVAESVDRGADSSPKHDTAFYVRALLIAWVLAVAVIGTNLLSVWIAELMSADQMSDILVPLSRRLAVLAVFATVPPLLAWALWRAAPRHPTR